jgi:hypothetical protein
MSIVCDEFLFDFAMFFEMFEAANPSQLPSHPSPILNHLEPLHIQFAGEAQTAFFLCRGFPEFFH